MISRTHNGFEFSMVDDEFDSVRAQCVVEGDSVERVGGAAQISDGPLGTVDGPDTDGDVGGASVVHSVVQVVQETGAKVGDSMADLAVCLPNIGTTLASLGVLY